MTLEELLGSKGYTYKDLGFYNDPDGSGQRENLSGWYRRKEGWEDPDGNSDQREVRIDPEMLSYYEAFGGDFGKLAQLGGYTGSNPARFLLGLENAQGQPIEFGSWATNPVSSAMTSMQGPEDTTPDRSWLQNYAIQDIQNWALPQVGMSEDQYRAGMKRPASESGFNIGNAFANAVFGIGTGALGAAALGMGPLAAASGTSGSGGIFGSSAPWATGADASWGVNPTSSGSGDFSLSGGTAGNPGGGLYSGAGGVTGITPGGAGVTGLTGTASAGSLLTPAMAASMGLPASAAMGGSGLTAAQAMGGVGGTWDVANYINNGTLPNGTVTPTPSLPSGSGIPLGAGSLLGRLFGGDSSNSDWTDLLGALGTAGIGAYAGNQQMDSYNALSDKMLGMGQPYRDRLNATYDPNWSFADTPDMQRSSQAAMDQAARALSTKFGNPADSPSAIGELLRYGIDNNLSKSFDYRNQLGQFGGLGAAPVSAGAQAGLLGTKAQGGIYEALGAGFENLTKPYKLNTGLSW